MAIILGTHYVREERGYHTPCWIWLKSLDTHGYAHGWHQGKLRLMHRVSYEARYGLLKPGDQIDHLCRNRDCVNPVHMEPVPAAVNVQRGASAKLTPMMVSEIRALKRTTSASYNDLADTFGVAKETVSDILKGRTWKNVT